MAGSDRAVKDKGTPLMNYLQHGHDGSVTFYFGGEGADLIGIYAGSTGVCSISCGEKNTLHGPLTG